MKRLFSIFWEATESLVFALGVSVVVYSFLFQPTAVIGSSSYPTVVEGERFITDKISYQFHSPERGDFVVVKNPKNPDIEFIKRIVGLPGEELMLSGGKVLIDKKPLLEPYLQSSVLTESESFLGNDQLFQIPDDSYFVMGDNREHSSDSRDFGPIKKEAVVGKVIFRFWPPTRLGQLTP